MIKQTGMEMLAAHARGLRDAGKGTGIALSAKACGNIARDLEASGAELAAVVECLRDVTAALDTVVTGYWSHMTPEDARTRRELVTHAETLLEVYDSELDEDEL